MDHEFKSTMGFVKDESLMWNYRIVVPDDIMDHYKDSDRRIVCTINDSEELHCALMPNGDGTYYIVTNKAFRKRNQLNQGDEVLVKLRQDESKYGTAVPDFFEEFCYQDPEGSVFFHALTKGKQRSLLHIMTKLKSEEKQLEKALIIFEHLKDVRGELDFKALNEAFKTSRFRK